MYIRNEHLEEMAVIQVIEDQASQRALLSMNLQEDGYDVISAASGKEALTQSQTENPDVILLDIILPDMGGLDVLNALKKINTLRDTPVIVVSGKNESSDITTALDLGAQDYITKPIQLPILNARIRTALRLSEQKQALKEANHKLLLLASHDSLTGLYNHRNFIERLNSEVSKAKRFQRPLSVIMIDIDHFKSINDQYGHQAGDKVLCHLTQIISDTVRDMDISGRLGGEEFAIVCPDTELAGALTLAERLRTRFKDTTIACGQKTIQFTASFGVSLLNTNDGLHHESENENENDDACHLLHLADQLLYKAKKKGRDQVCS